VCAPHPPALFYHTCVVEAQGQVCRCSATLQGGPRLKFPYITSTPRLRLNPSLQAPPPFTHKPEVAFAIAMAKPVPQHACSMHDRWSGPHGPMGKRLLSGFVWLCLLVFVVVWVGGNLVVANTRIAKSKDCAFAASEWCVTHVYGTVESDIERSCDSARRGCDNTYYANVARVSWELIMSDVQRALGSHAPLVALFTVGIMVVCAVAMVAGRFFDKGSQPHLAPCAPGQTPARDSHVYIDSDVESTAAQCQGTPPSTTHCHWGDVAKKTASALFGPGPPMPQRPKSA